MKTLLAGMLALGLAAALPAFAADGAKVSGYLLDGSGQVVKDPFGLCWRTGYWTPAMATQECDPELMPKKAAPAPAQLTPPPAPVPAPAVRKPVAEKVTLSADTLFDFDKSVVRADGLCSDIPYLWRMPLPLLSGIGLAGLGVLMAGCLPAARRLGARR